MSSSEHDKQRNREIAENEADRQTVGDVRVSVWAIAVSVVLQVAVVHLSFMNEAFDTTPLEPGEWLLCTALASVSGSDSQISTQAAISSCIAGWK